MIRTLGRILVVPASVLAVATLQVPYAAADHHNPPGSFSTSPSGSSSVNIGGSQSSTHTSPGTPSSSGSSSSSNSSSSSTSTAGAAPGLWLNNSGGSSCDPSLYPNGYSANFALPSPCIQPTTGPAKPSAAPVVTVQMVTDAASATAPTSPPHVEPGNRSFVNVPNNYWTDAPTVRTSVNVLGQVIPLTWTPTGTTWSFGDGSTATGNGVEGAAPGAAGALEHAYARQGSYDITTSTTYDLTFVLPGQGPQTIGLTSPPSPPVTLPVSEIQTRVSYAR